MTIRTSFTVFRVSRQGGHGREGVKRKLGQGRKGGREGGWGKEGEKWRGMEARRGRMNVGEGGKSTSKRERPVEGGRWRWGQKGKGRGEGRGEGTARAHSKERQKNWWTLATFTQGLAGTRLQATVQHKTAVMLRKVWLKDRKQSWRELWRGRKGIGIVTDTGTREYQRPTLAFKGLGGRQRQWEWDGVSCLRSVEKLTTSERIKHELIKKRWKMAANRNLNEYFREYK